MSKTGKIVKNSAYMYFRMIIVLLASLYTVRVTLEALGVIDLGIYGLVGGLVAMLAFLNSTMLRAGQRFLSIELGRDNSEALGRTFSAIFAANLAIAVAVVILGTLLGLWLISSELKVPVERLGAAKIVLYCSVVSSFAVILRTPFTALTISTQRIWFFSAASILEAGLKLVIAFLISKAEGDRLILYSLLMCAASWLQLAAFYVFCRFNYTEAKVRIHRDTALYKRIISFTSWSLIGSLSNVLRTHGANVLLNMFFGPALNAAHSVMTQAQSAATQFTSSLELSLTPQIYRSYGEGDLRSVNFMVFIGAKISFMLFGILIAPTIYGMEFIVGAWLGQSLEYVEVFISWMLLGHLFETASQPLMAAALATGNIKRYQLIVGTVILLNIPITLILYSIGLGPAWFLYVSLLIQVVTFALRIWLLKSMIGMSVREFCRSVVSRLALVTAAGVSIVSVVWLYMPPPHGFLDLVIGSVAIVFPLLLFCYFMGMTAPERSYVATMLRSRINRLRSI